MTVWSRKTMAQLLGLPPMMPSATGAITRNQYLPGSMSEKRKTINVKKSDKSDPSMTIPIVRVRPWRSRNWPLKVDIKGDKTKISTHPTPPAGREARQDAANDGNHYKLHS